MEKTKSDSRGRQVAKVLPAQTALTMTSKLAHSTHFYAVPVQPYGESCRSIPFGEVDPLINIMLRSPPAAHNREDHEQPSKGIV